MGIVGGEGRLIGGRYRLEVRLGRGGMGTVWRARDELLGRRVAVKELHVGEGPDEPGARVQRGRAMREARSVARIKHPNVVVVHDVVEQDGRPWIVMELVEGPSLADRLHSGGPVAPREAARIGVALLGALRAAHTRGVLHRDLKPANVLMEPGTGRVVLTDFGVAQVSGVPTLTDTGGFVGSPEYTAPERMAGRGTGPEADLWSLGVLLCAALSGASPFRRDSLGAVLHAVVSEEIELPEAARPLRAVVDGLLERDPQRRLGVAETEQLLRGYLRSGRAPEREHDPGADAHAALRDGAEGGPPGEHPPGEHPPSEGPLAAGVGPAAPAGPGPAPAAGGAGRTGGRAGGRAPGAPVLAAFDDRALAAAARPHTGRTRTALLVALAAVVIGGTGAGLTVLLTHRSGTDDGTGRSRQTSGPGPARGTGGATPTVTVTAPPAPAPAATLPAGYRLVRDPAGFVIAVPAGFRRASAHDRVSYSSRDGRFRIGVQLQKQLPQGPLGALRTADARGPADHPGYREGRVTETTHNGLRAGLWQFAWDGGAHDGGPRYTYDLCWDQGAKTIDVWISAPLGSRGEARRHLDIALDAFRLPGA
ncbi:serine/threonine protein kinase [Streptomyces sp. TM32]|uniref:serine/threonine-protein kinase n=1 Tax=Streptomyces sp. TM32 TaxID=1652669 RepID=UPI001010A2B3|nr:serine/threonine-protein kinase [Streptomyces sp. TM32]RXS67915.1 serine/threonine protein kinase [Streptomyces sp. TM32]